MVSGATEKGKEGRPCLAARTIRTMASIVSIQPRIGLEVHVELATRTKMFTAAPSAAHRSNFDAAPNTLIDPVVLGLPGALPVVNAAAVEMSMLVGLALGCSIAPVTRWDRKSYFYPDLPKNYQISQYDLPLCFDGAVDIPAPGPDGRPDYAGPTRRIGIIRAHLEEDAGKLLHEAPGGGAIDGSIVDYNRAGTPLLEIVTQPDFTSADEAVIFAQLLRATCRLLGVTEGIMQRGHMRFEPNINCVLTLDDGRTVVTPITEVKNLNSFRSLRGAIEHELAEQPRRWLEDGREHGGGGGAGFAGGKTTRGWDDVRGVTFLQREKEEAHDYRYFPDPDLPPLRIPASWRDAVAERLPELPLARVRRYLTEYAFSTKEAEALVDEPATCLLFEAAREAAQDLGVLSTRAARQAANFVLQNAMKRANERGVSVAELGVSAQQIAAIIKMREDGAISSTAADELFGLLCEPVHAGADPAALAEQRGMLIVRDDAAVDAWIDAAIAEHAKAAEDVRAGKMQAIGRLVGAVMKASGGAVDAAEVRERILKRLGGGN